MNVISFFDQHIWEIINSLGAIALFIFGMKIMSDGTQRIAGKQLRKYLNHITQKKITALFSGIGLTAAIQSSSAVSILTLSFINSGLFSLKKAFALLIGANIGTTLKLWIISLGYEFDFSIVCLPLIAISLPFYFSSKPQKQGWSVFIIGFSLMFIGLEFLKENLGLFVHEKDIVSYLSQFYEINYLHQLLFLLIGTLLTIVIQSSSATISIVIVVYSMGVPLELCAMLILGANIGTVSTALIASSVANVYAKATAYFHLAFNVLGAIIFFFITPSFISWVTEHLPPDNDFLLIALYHTLFNLVTALLIYPFLSRISNRVSTYIEKRNPEPLEDNININLLNAPFSITPEMYIYEANKKLLTFAGNIKQSITLLGRLITESDDDKFELLHQRIIHLEKEGDLLENEILNYLNKIYHLTLSSKNVRKIHHLTEVSKELETIGDISIKMSYTYKQRRETNSYITPKLRTYLLEIQDLVSLASTHLIQNINDSESASQLHKSEELENKIDHCFDEANRTLSRTIEKDKIKPISALYYRELIINYELISDHIFKAGKAFLR